LKYKKKYVHNLTNQSNKEFAWFHLNPNLASLFLDHRQTSLCPEDLETPVVDLSQAMEFNSQQAMKALLCFP
jgi:hypothetical protein